MYAQNGQAPEPCCALKRRRSEDGERSKRARAAAERGCESDGGLPSSDQPPAHHRKAVRLPPGDPPDLHGVCTLEEGSLKLKISLHRPQPTPDGDASLAEAAAMQPSSALPASCSAVQAVECAPRSDDSKASDAARGAAEAPVVARKVPASDGELLPAKDTLCSTAPRSAVKSDTQDAGSPQPSSHSATAPTSLDVDTSIPLAHPAELGQGSPRPRKSTTPGHYVPYEAKQNRRRLIQDTSKLRRKGRGHAGVPAPPDKSPHSSFHHVHMSVGQNGGRGFVNHNSIMDHPSVHARMFPPPESPPTKLAALLNSTRPPATSSAANQRAGAPSKAEHQPLDLSRALPRRSGPAPKCLDQMPGSYVPPIAVFYMRPGSRQRLDGIIRKLWAKHNSLLRGRPRP